MLGGLPVVRNTRSVAAPIREKPAAPNVPLVAAISACFLHLIGNPQYGFFRDELYFIICGQHPQWNYVDQPPIACLLAAASQMFGPSLFLLRAVPAVFAAGSVYSTCLLVDELGGASYAQIISALVVFFTPVLMDFGMKVSPDMVGLWLWPLLALYALRLTKGASPRLWLAIGALTGIGLQSKYSVLFFAVALVLGLLLTPHRRTLLSAQFLFGCAIAALIALPAFLWQAQYGFPMLELLRNTQHGKNVMLSPLGFLLQQVLITGLLSWVWIIGLVWLLTKPAYRFLGFAFLILIAIMIALHGKSYYPANAYPYLIAAGSVAIEQRIGRLRIVRLAVAAATVVLGMCTAPLVMPVLPEAQLARYQDRLFALLHIPRESIATEHHAEPELPSDFADMHGWPELASTVARVYQSLPADERSQAVILAQNYGEAAAIEFLAPSSSLPVISGHNQYFLWGPRGYSGNVLICVGGNCSSVSREFQTCSLAATFSAPWIQPYERGIPIMVCHGIVRPLPELWPAAKFYL